MRHPATTQDGYTLIELMAAAAIVALLTTLAYPAYTDHLLRSNRNAARLALAHLASLQESHHADRKAYARGLRALGQVADTLYVQRDASLVGDLRAGVYRITLDPQAARGSFALVATPVNGQQKDHACGTLRFDASGARSASGPDGARCWLR